MELKLQSKFLSVDNARQPQTPDRPQNNPNKQLASKFTFQTVEATPRLKLKDYLRLATITKRSNSNSSKKAPSPDNSYLHEDTSSTKQSVQILRQELCVDLNSCKDKIQDLLAKINKAQSQDPSQQQQYQQLVFLCELNRIVKQSVITSLQRANQQIINHRQNRMFKFAAKAQQLLGEELKKSQSPIRRTKNSYHTNKNSRSIKLESSNVDINLGSSVFG